MIISNFGALVVDFFNYVNTHGLRLYNEISLQHELGVFLRKKFPDYFIEYERNVSFFGVSGTIKKEIDVVIYNSDMSEKCAIELKFPRNKQYPEEMYAFVMDMKFMEQLKGLGFETYVLTLVDDELFYSAGKSGKASGIYSYFRMLPNIVDKKVYKPTGIYKGRKSISLSKTYSFSWSIATWNDGETNTPVSCQRYYWIKF